MENAPSSRYVLTPTQDAPEAGRILLRDGTVADIRPATPADAPALADFYRRQSPEARIQRFFSASFPSDDFVTGSLETEGRRGGVQSGVSRLSKRPARA